MNDGVRNTARHRRAYVVVALVLMQSLHLKYHVPGFSKRRQEIIIHVVCVVADRVDVRKCDKVS